MITLTATIELLKSSEKGGTNGDLEGATINYSGTNVSSDIGAVLGSKKRIVRPFVFGKSVLGKGDYLASNIGYFMSKQLSNENGNFDNSYMITVSGTDINAITLAFDDLNGAYPKSITIDGKPFVDDDPSWTIPLTKSNSHTIIISNWNKPNSPLIISGIYIDLNIEINRRNIQSIERSVFDRADTSMPSFGIISNAGSIDFIDFNGEVKDYAEQQILKSGLDVKIYLNDTLTKVSEVIAKLKTADWNYDSYNRAVSVSLKDTLEQWQEIPFEGYRYTGESKTAYKIFEYLKSKTPNTYEFAPLDTTTDYVLKEFDFEFPNIKSGSLWSAWNTFCEAMGMYIYMDRNKVICKTIIYQGII